jgi:alpha-tubulin suppressor-like RCC1 family protein
MTRRTLAAAFPLALLAACGTLKINIEYAATASPPVAESPPDFAGTLNAVSTWTRTPAGSSASAGAPSDSPEGTVALPADGTIAALAAGRNFTCAVTAGGEVKCWGNNDYGQLGDGTQLERSAPVNVGGLTDVKALTAGWGHVCALLQSGGVKCWGYNADGELGDGSTADSGAPVDVAGLSSGVVAIDAGDYHTCAMTDKHTLYCWGKNAYGQLGDWTKSSSAVPVKSPFFGGGVAEVAAGWGHTCVRTTEGWAKCWGNNAYGQMGFGKTTDIHLPAEDVVNLNGRVLKVTADGNQTCALTAGGGVQCWGDGRYGQLGDGGDRKRYEPAQVTGLTAGVSDVETGWYHACAVVSGGELRCWGWNFYGQLGDGTTVNQSAPVRVEYLTDGVKSIALGWGHTCVLTRLGVVKCWGLNGSGQLGNGTLIDSRNPAAVVGLAAAEPPAPTLTATPALTVAPSPTATPVAGKPPQALSFVSIAAGDAYSCAVTASGDVQCWGVNTSGQLGDGTMMNRNVPAKVVGSLKGAVAVSSFRSHTCALTNAGAVWCWGNNEYGQLGDGTKINRAIPVKVKGLAGGIRAVSAGGAHTCALTAEGAVMCWGGNYSGQLGDGSRNDSPAPVSVVGLSAVSILAISTGGSHTCAVTTGGTVKCWGHNASGQIGNGTNNNYYQTPVDVVGLSGEAILVSAGLMQTCTVLREGDVQCWGINFLGDGTGNSSSFPVKVANLKGKAAAVSVGGDHSCVVISSGGVNCWGFNSYGELGNGTKRESWMPEDVIGLQGVWKAVAAGGVHTCALSESGAVMCWGNNQFGELGDGTTIDRHAPVALAWIPSIPTATSATRPTPTTTCTFTSTPVP